MKTVEEILEYLKRARKVISKDLLITKDMKDYKIGHRRGYLEAIDNLIEFIKED